MTNNTKLSPVVPPPSDTPPPTGRRKGLLILALILLTVAAVAARMWWRGHHFEETDNAYLTAHVSALAARIPGVVHKVLVDDNQWVHAGDPLVELDPADQHVKVVQIKAEIIQADQKILEIDEQIKQGQAEVEATQALVARAQAQAQLHRHEAEAERVAALRDMQIKSVSKSELESAVAARDGASADVRAHRFQARAAAARTAAVEASRAVALAQKEVLAAQLLDAELQFKYTRIVAPVSGRVGRKSVEVGARVQAGQQLLAIVQDGAWVTANFKETQLNGLRAGQRARVRIDAFPGEDFNGVVDSFSPASGAQFALLPPDNATGNFTKIVQRIPVKVLLDPKDLQAMGGRLAPGMSARVEVDLRQDNPTAGAKH